MQHFQKRITALAVGMMVAVTGFGKTDGATAPFFSLGKSTDKVTFGVRAGLNESTNYMKSDYSDGWFKFQPGFHVGVVADVPLCESIHLVPGFYFQRKGSHMREIFPYYMSAISIDVVTKPVYLELPLLASFQFNLSRNVKLLANIGPYFAYGISGRGKGTINQVSIDEKYFGDGTRRFDTGLSYGVGMKIARHYTVGFALEQGLYNIQDKDETLGTVKVKNMNMMVSLGYDF